ncbi:Predicted Zn-dependent peptidase [Actinopolymorpha cephalotaxi]|uniref:Zn-dependent peptidase n=1 Tax=Actinopolymorpha cephalotaxi TaxID=504797 RepID=A0A1I2R9B7_9ACTN|nr:pitrilysin family protein [Actinopolymorpha cephalotaxi]NYH82310.1 putative Zn-dependent peptidase [Actinopolymorpha cephalotaxi]SFG37118.1 Predicted Zn-dependent peptidase [Actinopolymorpha cephalotaxi]
MVRRTVLPGGLRIITEAMPQVRSVSFGVWASVGSRDETPALAGASHYLEHLLFKGTRRRDAMEISSALDAVGGEMNAFTTKEYTCYYARVLDADLPLAVDVICDMVTSSLISAADVDSERGVILEEIAMHDDDPSDAVHDLFAEELWGDSPLGRPILGTTESIEALTRRQVHGYYRRRYRPESLVVSVAGNVEHRAVVRLVTQAFERAGRLNGQVSEPTPPRSGNPSRALASAAAAATAARGSVRLAHRPTEQANLVLGVPGVPRSDDRRFVLGVLNAAFGGGMSSRLFQEVREKRGLAYAVYSFASHYADSGMVGIYAGCLPSKIDEVLDICRDELAKVVSSGLTDEELERGKGQLRGSLVLGLEDTGSRMGRLAKADLVYGELLSVDEILRRIDAVTLDDVRQIAKELLEAAPTLAVVGPFEDADRFAGAVR